MSFQASGPFCPRVIRDDLVTLQGISFQPVSLGQTGAEMITRVMITFPTPQDVIEARWICGGNLVSCQEFLNQRQVLVQFPTWGNVAVAGIPLWASRWTLSKIQVNCYTPTGEPIAVAFQLDATYQHWYLRGQELGFDHDNALFVTKDGVLCSRWGSETDRIHGPHCLEQLPNRWRQAYQKRRFQASVRITRNQNLPVDLWNLINQYIYRTPSHTVKPPVARLPIT